MKETNKEIIVNNASKITRQNTPTVSRMFILHEGLLGVLEEKLELIDYDDLKDENEMEQHLINEGSKKLIYEVPKNKDQVNNITSIIAIIGLINLPIIKFSVEWWNTLHQPASVNLLSGSSIHPSMLIPLGIMTAAFALFSILIFLMKYNTELIKIKNKGLDRL